MAKTFVPKERRVGNKSRVLPFSVEIGHHKIEITGTLTAEQDFLSLKILHRKTKWIKLYRTPIICYETTNINEFFYDLRRDYDIFEIEKT